MHGFNFTEEDEKLLNQNMSEVYYSMGENIIKQGSLATHVLFLTSGLAKIYVQAENKRRMAVDVVLPQTFIGLPFIQTKFFQYSLEALSDVVFYQYRMSAFIEVIKRNSLSKENLMACYRAYYTQLLYKLEINSTRNNHGKLAHTLYSLYNRSYLEPELFCYLTRKDLAELASISKESTNKILKELQHDGIINISDGTIKITEPGLLQRLSLIG
jgi:CRP/FNR family transcriptional regulator